MRPGWLGQAHPGRFLRRSWQNPARALASSRFTKRRDRGKPHHGNQHLSSSQSIPGDGSVWKELAPPAGGLQARVKFGVFSLDFSALGAQLLRARAGGARHPSLIQTQPGHFYLPKPREQSFQKLLWDRVLSFHQCWLQAPLRDPRMGELGRDLWAHLSKPSRTTRSRAPRTVSRRLLELSKDGAQFQCSVTPTVQHYLLIFRQKQAAGHRALHQDQPNPSVSPSSSRTRCGGFWSEHARVSPLLHRVFKARGEVGTRTGLQEEESSACRWEARSEQPGVAEQRGWGGHHHPITRRNIEH